MKIMDDELVELPDKYWHCLVKVGSKRADRSILNDLTRDQLLDSIVRPWRENQVFTVDGRIVRNQESVQEIKITQTGNPKKFYADKHNRDMRNSGVADMATDRRLLPINKGKDYTMELLFSEPTTSNPQLVSKTDTTNIFIVHGHDGHAKESVARFVERVGLTATILHEQPNEGKTIIEKFEKHSDVGYAIVLLTPDDVGGTDPEALRPRARQNVILELGYMVGKLGRKKVCALRKGDLDIPSDLHGVLYVNMDDDGAWKYKVANELKTAGYTVDLNLIG